mmetsp:Transcript_35888/g.107172  ORF Transcript_35888/g.107172 Transcript_35888/m.107172 type:complete len:314 (-) Transcript_35888:1432-2373(-)
MSRGHLHLDAHGSRAALLAIPTAVAVIVVVVVVAVVSQFRREFRGFPILNSRIVQSARQKHGGIRRPLSDVIDRTVSHHVIVISLFVGIAPFFPFARGQGYGRVDHGGDDVDERHAEYGRPEQLGALIDRCTHEESPRRSSLAAQSIGIGELPIAHEPPSRVDEIAKRILLAQIFRPGWLLVPRSSEFSPPPDVRQRVHDPPIEEGEARRRKVRLDGTPVRSVPVQMNGDGCGGGALLRKGVPLHHVLAIDESDGNSSRAVPRRYGGAFAPVQRFVVSGHDLRFEDPAEFGRIVAIVQGDRQTLQRGDDGIVR